MINDDEFVVIPQQKLLDDEHQDSLWYGGRVLEVEYKGYTFILGAYGDVFCTLLDKEGREIAYTRDKGNNGYFYSEMARYISGDEELAKAIEEERLLFDANNWWEILIDDPDGRPYDTGWVCSGCLLGEALDELKCGADEMIADISKEN